MNERVGVGGGGDPRACEQIDLHGLGPVDAAIKSAKARAVVARTRAINHLKALIVSAPEDLRAQLRTMTSDAQINYCAALRTRPTRDLEHHLYRSRTS